MQSNLVPCSTAQRVRVNNNVVCNAHIAPQYGDQQNKALSKTRYLPTSSPNFSRVEVEPTLTSIPAGVYLALPPF